MYVGALLSPEDVASATKSRPHPKALAESLQRWTLCGDVWPDLFEVLQVSFSMNGLHERISSLDAPSGRHYAIITHQAGSYQHRYLLPLFDAKVAKCIEEISRDGRLGYSLAGEGQMAIVWASAMQAHDFAALRELCGEVPEGEEEDALDEYACALLAARAPEQVPSLIDGTDVQYAGVSAVAPQELVLRFARRHPEAWARRKVVGA